MAGEGSSRFDAEGVTETCRLAAKGFGRDTCRSTSACRQHASGGEFGRIPKGTLQPGTSTGKLQWGRDHWPGAQSILISGGGFRMGQVIASTDGHAAYPQERPLDPQDLMATLYRHLGIDLNSHFPDGSGRPVAITTGTPIRELG